MTLICTSLQQHHSVSLMCSIRWPIQIGNQNPTLTQRREHRGAAKEHCWWGAQPQFATNRFHWSQICRERGLSSSFISNTKLTSAIDVADKLNTGGGCGSPKPLRLRPRENIVAFIFIFHFISFQIFMEGGPSAKTDLQGDLRLHYTYITSKRKIITNMKPNYNV